MKVSNDSSGFTIIEVVVTLAVTALFLTFFFQMYLAMESQRISVARQALASDLAYSNLRKFTTRPAEADPCDAASMDLTGPLPNNGKDLTFIPEPTEGLGSGVGQTVRAFAPKGCALFASNPVKIESTITYGNGEKVVHASYLN